MDAKTIDNVCRQVYNRFPEVSGVSPRIQSQEPAASGGTSAKGNYLFVFHGKGLTANGKSIPRTVRVVVSERGKIVKMTTSR